MSANPLSPMSHSITDKSSHRHTPICHCTEVIRTHLGACHSGELGEGVCFLLICLFSALTFSCFVFFSNILIRIGSFARREVKYTSCIFRTASARRDRELQCFTGGHNALYEPAAASG